MIKVLKIILIYVLFKTFPIQFILDWKKIKEFSTLNIYGKNNKIIFLISSLHIKKIKKMELIIFLLICNLLLIHNLIKLIKLSN
jgi:hypothetical protein